MNLVLIGYRGSGKSIVGATLSNRIGYGFLDLDEQIARSLGRTIRDVFESEGEAGFRRHEHEALGALAKLNRHVIALGGGALDDPENQAIVRRLGRVVWLRAPAIVLWTRIRSDEKTPRDRPDLTAAGGLSEVEVVLARREPVYRKCSNHVIDTMSMLADEVAEAIELWHRAGDSAHG